MVYNLWNNPRHHAVGVGANQSQAVSVGRVRLGLFRNCSFLEQWGTGGRLWLRGKEEGFSSIELFHRSRPTGTSRSAGRSQFLFRTPCDAENQSACVSNDLHFSSPQLVRFRLAESRHPVQVNSCPRGTTPIYGIAVIRPLTAAADP